MTSILPCKEKNKQNKTTNNRELRSILSLKCSPLCGRATFYDSPVEHFSANCTRVGSPWEISSINPASTRDYPRMTGEESLCKLKRCLTFTERAHCLGVCPRNSPFQQNLAAQDPSVGLKCR